MIALSAAVVVEGRYDAARLATITDALIVQTDGFGVFTDPEKQELIRRLAGTTGVIVLTDSDAAGFRIRKFIEDITGGAGVRHAYIPEIPGKEPRKRAPGAEGLLGVEGVDSAVIEAALRRFCVEQTQCRSDREIAAGDLYADGLYGTPGAGARRNAFKRNLGFPARLSRNAFLKLLNTLVGYDEYKRQLSHTKEEPPGTDEKEA
ncbi:MAG: DUF4093 domain-containing protein [Oscillospiraceae bacterium]|nr:DUF4093 domain-containing protein [Oscillospiraceae bacterium]